MNSEMYSIEEARALARSIFLRDDNMFGCAETTYMTLKYLFNLENKDDTASAMVLNGGIAYSGSTCGAITGAAMALGELAEKRMGDHQTAKRTARKITMKLMKEFLKRFASLNCIDLINLDISRQADHDQFIESGIWRTKCMEQIEFSVEYLRELGDPHVWETRIKQV